MKEKQLMDGVFSYRTTMSLMQRLVSQGVITAEEYANIDTIIAKKHGLSLGSIFSMKP